MRQLQIEIPHGTSSLPRANVFGRLVGPDIDSRPRLRRIDRFRLHVAVTRRAQPEPTLSLEGPSTCFCYADPLAASRQRWKRATSLTTTAYGCNAIIFALSDSFLLVKRNTFMPASR
jgi:hypothetical protein